MPVLALQFTHTDSIDPPCRDTTFDSYSGDVTTPSARHAPAKPTSRERTDPPFERRAIDAQLDIAAPRRA